ncbi:inorganic diphosphatase [Candidatus Uhrbacteria bacterium]|nr:inorganic diphosphatase [Candidatus Uhrbacteria bacterium]
MTSAKDLLGNIVDVIVDRPLGSKHPTHDFTYLVNYGFVPGTQSPDGEELDAYLLGIDKPLQNFRGRCVAIIHRTNDDDDKLIVVPSDMTITDDQIRQATHFQEQYFHSEIIRTQEF